MKPGKSSGRGALQGRFGRAVLIDLDAPVVAHAHPHCHVLINVSAVRSMFNVGGRQCAMTDDVAVLVNSWEPHGFPHSPGMPSCTMLGLYIDVDWLARVDRTFGVSTSRHFFPHPCGQLSPRLRALAYAIAETLVSRTADAEACEPLLLALMVGIIENLSLWRELRNTPQAADTPIADFRLRCSLSFMREHVSERCSMEQVAQACGLSRPHFFELFSEAFGVTPGIYFSALRMEAAYALIPDGEMSLGRMADQLGFSAPSHFTRFFRNNLGIPPRDYRRLITPSQGRL